MSWLLVSAQGMPLGLFQEVLRSAVRHNALEATKNVVRACAFHFSNTDPDADAMKAILVEAIHHLHLAGDDSWIRMAGWFSWFHSEILRALVDADAQLILSWLTPIPQLDDEVDHIVAALGVGRPALVLDFLDQRMALAGGADVVPGFVAIPYELHEVTKALKLVPQELLAVARRWFDASEESLDYSVERLIEAVFDDLPIFLDKSLRALLQSGQRSDALFALEVLASLEGQDLVFELAREAVGNWGHDEGVLSHVHSAIAQEGGTVGFYGRAKALQRRKTLLEEWRTDARASVRSFAEEEVQHLDQRIGEETRRTQAFLAKRRLDYGEDPLGDTPADEPSGPEPA